MKSRLYQSALLFLLVLLCVLLSSCSFSLESVLTDLKAYINGEDVSQPPEDFVESRENKTYAYDVYQTYVVLTGYLGEEVEVTIPKKIDGLPVRRIASLAFYDGVAVESVTVPEGVTELDENAFYYCQALTEISLPKTLTTVGDKAFSWCSSLTEIVLPEQVKAIPAYCFNQCTSLTSVTFTSDLTSIGARAFSGCSSLTSLYFGDRVSSVGSYAFRGCGALKSVRLPGACSIGTDVFAECPEQFSVITEPDSACWTACTELGISVKAEDGSAVVLPDETADESVGDSSEETTDEET